MMQFELFEGKDNFPTIVKYVGRGGSDYATELVAFQQVVPSNTVPSKLKTLWFLAKRVEDYFLKTLKLTTNQFPRLKNQGEVVTKICNC